MPDDLPRRGPGRPPLAAGQKSIDVHFRVPAADYDRACALAEKHRTTVTGIFRAAFRVATKRQHTLDEP